MDDQAHNEDPKHAYANGVRDGRIASLEKGLTEITEDFKKIKIMIYMLYGAIALVQFLPDVKEVVNAVP